MWRKSQKHQEQQIQINSSFAKFVVRRNPPGLSKESRVHCIRASCVLLCTPHSTCVWGFHMQLLAQRWAAQIPFQPSLCQTPLYLCSTELPYTSPVTAKGTHWAISMSTHVHTSIAAAQEIPELHVGSRYAEDRTPVKQQLPVCASSVFHFLVILYAVTYRRGKPPAHWLFRTDTPGRLSFISTLMLPSPKLLCIAAFLLLLHVLLLLFTTLSLILSILDWQQTSGEDWSNILSVALPSLPLWISGSNSSKKRRNSCVHPFKMISLKQKLHFMITCKNIYWSLL